MSAKVKAWEIGDGKGSREEWEEGRELEVVK